MKTDELKSIKNSIDSLIISTYLKINNDDISRKKYVTSIFIERLEKNLFPKNMNQVQRKEIAYKLIEKASEILGK